MRSRVARSCLGLLATTWLAGCASTVELLPPAERPRPRQMVELEYVANSGERRPIQVAYFEVGTGDELFVLVHGLSTNADVWARVVEGFAEHGKVISVDLPGCGWSDAPQDFDYDAVGVTDILAQFVNAAPTLAGLPAGTRPVVVGASLGGGFVTYCTITGAIEPQALLLAAPAAFPMQLPFYIEVVRGPLGPFLFWLSTLADYEDLASFSIERKEVLTPDLGEMFAAQFRDPERRRAAYLINRNGIDVDLARETSGRVSEIEVPTLVVFGAQDVVIPPEHARLWSEELPRALVVTLEECGHNVPEERPDEFLALCGQLLGWPGGE